MTKFNETIANLQKKVMIIDGELYLEFQGFYQNSFDKIYGAGEFEKQVLIPAKKTYIDAMVNRFSGYIEPVLAGGVQ